MGSQANGNNTSQHHSQVAATLYTKELSNIHQVNNMNLVISKCGETSLSSAYQTDLITSLTTLPTNLHFFCFCLLGKTVFAVLMAAHGSMPTHRQPHPHQKATEGTRSSEQMEPGQYIKFPRYGSCEGNGMEGTQELMAEKHLAIWSAWGKASSPRVPLIPAVLPAWAHCSPTLLPHHALSQESSSHHRVLCFD